MSLICGAPILTYRGKNERGKNALINRKDNGYKKSKY